MDGLECSEVSLSETISNKDFRIDSAFFTSNIIKNKNLKYEKIGKCLNSTQYGISIEMNEDGNGYPIFRMNEIHKMLCDLEVEKYANLSVIEFERFVLKDRDVLFNRTNSFDLVGRTGIYYKGEDDKIFASYLVRLNTNQALLLPEYLTAFLNTKYGIADIKRRARQSINQTNVNPEEVKEIEIPLLNSPIQKKIETCFTKANKNIIIAASKYKQAERLLLTALNIESSHFVGDAISVKELSKSFIISGRLDAEYYQPKYDKIASAINMSETVGSICNIYDKGFTPKDDEMYQYIELANVGATGNIDDVENTIGKELPSRARRQVKTGQVIISSVEGSLQSCALITEEYNNALCSTGFYVIDSEYVNSETLLVLFKSEAIQALLKQRCSGTILTAITKDELLRMPLPKIDDDIQKDIAKKIQESFALRSQSEKLLEKAKRAVEVAIEEGEEKALQWLCEV